MRAHVAEFVGTFALVFIGCGAIAVTAQSGTPGEVGIALAFGLVIAVMIYALGHVSGAHFNPAVSVAFALGGHLSWLRAATYGVAQIAGATAGAWLLRATLGDGADIGVTKPSGSDAQSLAWETVLAFFLVLVITAVVTDSRATGEAAALAIGAAVAMGALVGGPVSGASMNPARSIGPALVTDGLASLWIYIAGPLLPRGPHYHWRLAAVSDPQEVAMHPVDQDAAPIAGELVTETFDYDGGRQVTVYIPPDPPEAIVFAGDGQMVSQWGGTLEAVDVPPTMIVGVHRTADQEQRLHEYSPGFEPERFAAHERLFVEDVRRWTRTRFGIALPAARTAVYGASAGGELSLAIGLRHPGVYGAMLAASPGAGYRPPDPLPGPLPRAYLVAGSLEPFYLESATRWAAALRQAGADVVMRERVAGHDDAMWRTEFPLMIAWAFGTGPTESTAVAAS